MTDVPIGRFTTRKTAASADSAMLKNALIGPGGHTQVVVRGLVGPAAESLEAREGRGRPETA